MILNLRSPRQMAVIAFLLLLSFGVALFRIDVSLEYCEAGRVSIAWGDGEGQVPVSTSRDGTQFGIRCFCDGPRGIIFVADWERGRVLKYDASGELMEALDVGRRRVSLDDMALLPSGAVLLADNSTGEIVSASAEEAPRILWSQGAGDAAVGHIESIEVGENGLVYVATTLLEEHEYRRRLSVIGGGSVKTIAEVVVTPSGSAQHSGFEGGEGGEGGLPAPAVTFRASRRGGFYVIPEGGGPTARRILRYRPDGSLCGEFRVEVRGPAESVTLTGDDSSGRIYVGISLGTLSGRICVYDRNGSLSTEIQAPYEGKMRSNSYARVDADGNLSVLEAGERGAVIRRFAPVQRKLLVRR